jgi:HlyD family type I secretion membrane fusion protein
MQSELQPAAQGQVAKQTERALVPERSSAHPAQEVGPERVDPNTRLRDEALRSITREGQRLTLYGFAVVGVFFGGLVTWSALAPLDSAVMAAGQVVVEGNRKSIQQESGGVIKEIRRRDGELVEAGDVLITLDDTRPRATYQVALSRFRELKALQARLLAEEQDADSIAFPPTLSPEIHGPDIEPILEGQRRIFETRRRTLLNTISILERQISDKEAEIRGLQDKVASHSEQLELLTQEIESMEELLKKGLATKPRLLALQRARSAVGGTLGEDSAAIARASQAIQGLRLQIVEVQNKYQDNVAGQLRETEGKLSEVYEQMQAARHEVEQTVVRAPQRGVVVGLKVHTEGGVVAPGAVMMQIVPQDDKLLVEAKLRPQDIEHVAVGLPTSIRMIGFNSRVTPLIEGKLVYVSADALVDPETSTSYYLARAEVDLAAHPDTKDIELQPGMPVQMMIRTGTRTVLDYLLSPLMDGIYLGMRES